MSFTVTEREAVTNGRVDFYAADGVSKLREITIATEWQKTNGGLTWTDWIEQHVEAGHMQIRIWDADRY